MQRNFVMQDTTLDMSWSDFLDEVNRSVDDSVDAMICSLNDKGVIDIEYMSDISGISMSRLIEELDEYIFQDPMSWNECWYLGYKTKEEYLSGDILAKFNLATEANTTFKGRFNKNIKALKEIMPTTIPYKDIHFSIASAWMDKDIIIKFVTDVFNGQVNETNMKYISETDKWVILDNVTLYNSANYTFGTSRIDTKSLLLKILNHKEIRVYDPLVVDGKTKYKFNKEETILALEKAEILEKTFKTFIVSHGYEERIEKAYNEKFRYVINRKYDGSFLKLDGLYDYQKDAVARIIFNKNTLLAHNVGAGKTYIMITAGEELLRLGYSKKNLYVVPNNIIGQWEEIYRKLYPNSKLLVVYPKSYTINTKDVVLEDIKNGNYDAVITTYSVFDRIEHNHDLEIEFLNAKIAELTKIQNTTTPFSYLFRYYGSNIKKYEKKIQELQKLSKPTSLTFEELGFTRLFVDEAHNYKNIGLECSRSNLGGISIDGSTKCKNMLMAIDYLRSNNHGVIMATGTPITNSVSDIYVFQRYLQNSELKLLDIDTFDKWLSVFAEITDEIEVDVDTTKYVCKSRINRFYNIEELTVLLSNVADFCNPNQTKVLPKCNGYIDTVVDRNRDFDLYLADISKRVERIRRHEVDKSEDNLLKITVDGRLAALDLRLVSQYYFKPYQNKVDSCVVNVCNNYVNYPDTTQIIFCDLSVPKDEFNVYDELKYGLNSMGIPLEEIEFIHNGSTEAKKKKILKAFNDGDIRVLIGSTFKLGTGVNVQNKLIAIHHFDVPWRPSDMMQREGRIIREGNTNEEVFIYRYIQKASFDAYSWQILERKAKIIRDMLANTLTEKETSDIDDVVLSYAEVKALAVGNDKIKEHIELCNKRSHIMTLAKKQNERYNTLEYQLEELNGELKTLRRKADYRRKDKNIFYNNFEEIINILNSYNFKKDSMKYMKVREFLESNRHKDEETLWFTIPGFEIVLPEGFLSKNKYILVKGNGTYQIKFKLKMNEYGSHIYDVLTTEILVNYEEDYLIKDMELSIKSIEGELRNKISYDKEINDLSMEISRLEGELGIYEQRPNE